jgi:hypothetical protein
MKWSRATIPEHVIQMKNMNRGACGKTNCLRPLQGPSALGGEGKAIMGSTDGSVQDSIATTYSFVISISRTDVAKTKRRHSVLRLAGFNTFLPIIP